MSDLFYKYHKCVRMPLFSINSQRTEISSFSLDQSLFQRPFKRNDDLSILYGTVIYIADLSA